MVRALYSKARRSGRAQPHSRRLPMFPIVPCVILGTDRFYSKKQWLPFRRTPVWIAFGKPISCFPELQKSQARERIESELAAAFKNLYAELREKFRLTTDDLPQSPQERMSNTAVIPSEVEGSRCNTLRQCREIPRLRFAPLGMTRCGARAQKQSIRFSAHRSIGFIDATR